MTVRMFDGAFAPRPDRAKALLAEGFQVAAGYLDSPGAYHPWVYDEWRAVSIFPGRWGIAFPGSDPVAMCAQAKGLGLTGVVLDLESQYANYPTYRAISAAWGDKARGMMPTVIYSTRAAVTALQGNFDGLWIAEYGPKPAGVPAKQAVQWWNSHVEQGTSIDESLADPWFVNPGAQPAPAPVPNPGGDDLTDHDVMAILSNAVASAAALKNPPDRSLTPWRQDILDANTKRLAAYRSGAEDLQSLVNDILRGYAGL